MQHVAVLTVPYVDFNTAEAMLSDGRAEPSRPREDFKKNLALCVPPRENQCGLKLLLKMALDARCRQRLVPTRRLWLAPLAHGGTWGAIRPEKSNLSSGSTSTPHSSMSCGNCLDRSIALVVMR